MSSTLNTSILGEDAERDSMSISSFSVERSSPETPGNVQNKSTSTYEKALAIVKGRPILFGFIAFNILLWPIVFLVIIPAIIQSICNSTGIEIKSALITNPTNTDFDSAIVVEFGKSPPIPATVKINQLTASWNGAGGGNLLVLSNTNTVSISTKPTTLYAEGEVSSVSAMSTFLKSAVSATALQWTLQGDGSCS